MKIAHILFACLFLASLDANKIKLEAVPEGISNPADAKKLRNLQEKRKTRIAKNAAQKWLDHKNKKLVAKKIPEASVQPTKKWWEKSPADLAAEEKASNTAYENTGFRDEAYTGN